MKTKKILSSILLILLLLLTSCRQEEKIIKIKVDILNNETFYIDEFNISDYYLKLYLDNDLITKIPLELSMLSKTDQEKLLTPGKHTLTFTYQEFTDQITINLSSEDLNNIFNLSIFELNDTHGYIEQNEHGKGGLSNTAYIIDSERRKNNLDDVLLIANGDMFQGTAVSNLTYGKAVIDAMNEMDFDAMGIGNHEFDWGLDKILNYFDNDKNNGEAMFPLLNANIYERATNNLLINDSGKMFESIIIKKEDINVGVVSFIGDVANSINATFYAPYLIKNDIETRAKAICERLKNDGADIIVVNVHGGESSGVDKYEYNSILSNIKINGEYVVDAIINGHTHTRQKGYIKRLGDVSVPVVQSGGNNSSIGKIELNIDKTTKDVISTNVTNINVTDTLYSQNVESIIDEYSQKISDEVYTVSGETISSKSVVGIWASKVIRKATNAHVALINTGGIRSTGGIVKDENITINNMYEIMPFNNQLCMTKLKGYEIYRLLDSGWYYYDSLYDIEYYKNNNDYFILTTVDYVYNQDYFPGKENGKVINLYSTDLLIMEAKLHDILYISNSEIRIGKQISYE